MSSGPDPTVERQVVSEMPQRELSAGGPWLFRPAAESAPQLLWQIIPHCRDLACPCREVDVRVAHVDDDLDAYAEEGETLLLWYKDGAGHRPPNFLGRVGTLLRDPNHARPPRALIRVRIEFRRGSVQLSPLASDGERAEELIPAIREHIDGALLDALYNEFRTAQGYAVRTRPQMDKWTDWRPGGMVAWSDAYPDARHDQYQTASGIYCAHDMYCVRPACPCNTARITFFSDRHQAVGTAKVHLDSGRLVKFEASGGQAKLAGLWAMFGRRHRVAELLHRRSAHLVEHLGPHLYGTTYRPKVAPNHAPISRNAVCPCGSGKKYKKCCGADPAL